MLAIKISPHIHRPFFLEFYANVEEFVAKSEML